MQSQIANWRIIDWPTATDANRNSDNLYYYLRSTFVDSITAHLQSSNTHLIIISTNDDRIER